MAAGWSTFAYFKAFDLFLTFYKISTGIFLKRSITDVTF